MSMSNRKKTYANKNSKGLLFTSVTAGRGKAILDFLEETDQKPNTFRQNKKGKFKKSKKK